MEWSQAGATEFGTIWSDLAHEGNCFNQVTNISELAKMVIKKAFFSGYG